MSVTWLLPTFDVNKPRKFGHPVLKQPLHVYKLRVAISSSRYYIIFPLLKAFETRIVPGSKCQSRRIRPTSTLWMWQNKIFAGTSSFSKRIFWKLIRLWKSPLQLKEWFLPVDPNFEKDQTNDADFNNSWYAYSQSIFPEDREQLQLFTLFTAVWGHNYLI